MDYAAQPIDSNHRLGEHDGDMMEMRCQQEL
jgi:hypothetical protein